MKPFSTVLLLCGAALLASALPQRGIFGGLRALLDGGQSRLVRQQSVGGGGVATSVSGACKSSGTNHKFGGKGYLVSWRLGCTEFTQVNGMIK